MRALLRTLSTHKLSASAGVLYALMWVIVLLPPRADTFIVQRWLLAGVIAVIWLDLLTATIVIGIVAILATLVGLPDLMPIDLLETGSRSTIMPLIFCGGLLLFPSLLWAVKNEWQRRGSTARRLLTGVVVPLYLVCGAFAANVLQTLPDVRADCPIPLSEPGELRIRVVHSLDDHVFAEYRQGGAWKQSLHVTDTGLASDRCAQTGTAGESFAWFWTDRIVATSDDGGRSWTVFDDWATLESLQIASVTFQSRADGALTVYQSRHPSTYTTTDGGRSWQLQLAHE
ncbi:MAG TPA: hypothetical protein PKD09_25140 [Aggregatilinea sp.]|uniref:hypothetical protein n=1 Tax=Aggregatilinea sp. TaxID=2806333 RepID=UPI002B73829A|nr:hypothetical protein [Aggregatilinea sp.]HML24964.1 hypothetical protein [Aggregatilinea sp.]